MNKPIAEGLPEIEGELKENGISMQTFIKNIYHMILDLNLAPDQKIYITERMAEIEYRLSLGCQ